MPVFHSEGNHVEVSKDLFTWEQLTYLAGKQMTIHIPNPVRYLRFRLYPDRIVEIEGYKNHRSLQKEKWKASNLFAHPRSMKPVKTWKASVKMEQWVKGSYFCISLDGEHGVEGAYAALKIDGELVGCPDRAPSFPSNTWEYVNAKRDKNYTYFVPVTKNMVGKSIEVYVLAYNEDKININPKVWITAYPAPYEEKWLILER